MDARVALRGEVLASMEMGRVFKEHKAAVNSLDFSRDGALMVSSGDDSSIRLYRCDSGKQEKVSFCKKYGCTKVAFTHANNAVISASNNKWDGTLRYLSLYDNSYLRFFKGHRDSITSLCMSPLNDTFITASLDSTARQWDLRCNPCQALMHLSSGYNAVGFDPTGEVMGVASSAARCIKLFDVNNLDKGPFDTFFLDCPAVEITQIKFSNDGRSILLVTNQSLCVLLDAYSGDKLGEITDYSNSSSAMIEASFTPDSEHILVGGDDGSIKIFSREGLSLVGTLSGHVGPVTSLKFNPKYLMMGSACENVAMWIPREEVSSASL